ncbi:hypothetical protein [Streptomyces phaeofaciens]|uniref:hypothetical protein n=1 Tax=Streptomyces phaeofaciens TaxID=68254 RepID=UPI001671E2C6|nr:hypothetical protein [Streptomyces phaeofaciens]
MAGALAPAGVNANLIRRTCKTVLGEQRVGPPVLGEEQRAHLAGVLRGQDRLVLEDVLARIPEMSGETRETALHVVRRVGGVLTVGYVEARDADGLLELAVLSRSLLSLYELLGS